MGPNSRIDTCKSIGRVLALVFVCVSVAHTIVSIVYGNVFAKPSAASSLISVSGTQPSPPESVTAHTVSPPDEPIKMRDLNAIVLPPPEYSTNDTSCGAGVFAQSEAALSSLQLLQDRWHRKIAKTKIATTPPFDLYICSTKHCGCDMCRNIHQGVYAPILTNVYHNILFKRCQEGREKGRPPAVVSIGSSIGYFPLYAAAMGCQVYAFEPREMSRMFLLASAQLNNLVERVHVYSHKVDLLNAIMQVKSSGKLNVDDAFAPKAASLCSVTDKVCMDGLKTVKTMPLSSIKSLQGCSNILLLHVDAPWDRAVYDGVLEMVDQQRFEHVIYKISQPHEKPKVLTRSS
jgi:hypothetical protein